MSFFLRDAGGLLTSDIDQSERPSRIKREQLRVIGCRHMFILFHAVQTQTHSETRTQTKRICWRQFWFKVQRD